ncbi:MAG: hypothetical protein ACPG31_12950 [Planctomycetota bacterium]
MCLGPQNTAVQEPSTSTIYRSVPHSQAFAAEGVNLSTTMDLIGHQARIDEICVAPNNRFVASRDRDGVCFLWTLQANGSYVGVRLAMDQDDAYSSKTVFTFNRDGSQLITVLTDHRLHFLATASPEQEGQILSLKKDEDFLPASSALALSEEVLAVGGHDGGLYLADRKSGKVTKQLVPPHDEKDRMTRNYTILQYLPNAMHFFAANNSVVRTSSSAHAPRIVDWHAGKDVVVMDGRGSYDMGQFIPAAKDRMFLVTCGESRGLALFENSTLKPVDGQPILSRSGIGRLNEDLTLGCDKASFALIRLNEEQKLTEERWKHEWQQAIRCVGSAELGGAVFLGLDEGVIRIVEIVPDAE